MVDVGALLSVVNGYMEANRSFNVLKQSTGLFEEYIYFNLLVYYTTIICDGIVRLDGQIPRKHQRQECCFFHS